MTGRILTVALLAGLLAGLAISAIQAVTTTPLILHAEEYEGPDHAAAHRAGGGYAKLDPEARGLPAPRPILAHGGAPAGASPEQGAVDVERLLKTTLANVLTAFGFALLLCACYVLHGAPLDGRRGVLWGIAGYTVVSLAPALGLPPELPGTIAAELTARQTWWAMAAAATAGGLWLMVFGRARWMAPAGVVLMALPHLAGAPHPEEMGGDVPPELAARFAAASLVTAAVFWSMLGWLSGTLSRRFRLTD